MEEFKPNNSPDNSRFPNSVIENREKINLRIICAEDNPMIQKLMFEILSEKYSEVRMVGNGQELLNALSLPGAQFDIVLTDNNMKVLSGVKAIKEIRGSSDIRFKNIPIVMISTDDSVAKPLKEQYDTDFIDKPFSAKSLCEKIDELTSVSK